MKALSRVFTCLLVVIGGVVPGVRSGADAGDRGDAWVRHTIDRSGNGADGVRLGDANGDGLPDVVTGWEESGVVNICLNPGPEKIRGVWPSVAVGQVRNVEDAVFVDLDADGALDVVSACEGETRRVYVHWAPKDRSRYLNPMAWEALAIPESIDRMQWMYVAPAQVDGKHGIDLVAGGKNRGAEIGWFEAPEDARDLSAWKWHPMSDAGWVMSLLPRDMDGDGDVDVAVSDRKGRMRGCRWLENPGKAVAASGKWLNHAIGGGDVEVMFMTLDDLNQDDIPDAVAAAKPQKIDVFLRKGGTGDDWERLSVPFPQGAGSAKAVASGDIDLDGTLDLVFSCEHAGGRSGVMWLSCAQAVTDSVWTGHEISGLEGTKFDLVQLLDLDGDGDLDVLTCEETENLGVFWYENPLRKPEP